jgi:hypothetical protein
MSAEYSRPARRAYVRHLPPGIIQEWAKPSQQRVEDLLIRVAEVQERAKTSQQRAEELLLRGAEVRDLSDKLWLQLLDRLAKGRAPGAYPLVTAGSAVLPDRACFLLDLLLAKADRETILADLEEEFTTYFLPKYGARRARFWFWKQTVKTIAYRNAVCRWVLVTGLARFGEWILRGFSG